MTPGQHSNFANLYADVFFYGVLAGSAIAFLPVYATHLGGTGFQIGLITAGPAVINLLVSLPAGHWLEGRPVIGATFYSSIWHRAGYLLLALLPLALAAAPQLWIIPLVALLMSLPGTVLAIAFNAMFADVVPPEHRGLVVGRRNALLAVSLTGSTLLSGWVLDRVIFPVNYEIVFGMGLAGAIASSYFLGRIKAPASLPLRVGRPLGEVSRPGWMRFIDSTRDAVGLRFLARSSGQRLLRLDLLRGPFGVFLTAYFFFYLFQMMSVPIMPLMLVKELRLTDGEISLGNGVFYAVMTVGSMVLGRLTARFGHKPLLAVGAVLYGVYPLLISLAHDRWLFYAASLGGGLVWAVTNGGLVNRLMERVPETDRPAHMALHNLALNFGILGGSLLGPALGEGLGLRHALLLAAVLRMLAGVGLAVWG